MSKESWMDHYNEKLPGTVFCEICGTYVGKENYLFPSHLPGGDHYDCCEECAGIDRTEDKKREQEEWRKAVDIQTKKEEQKKKRKEKAWEKWHSKEETAKRQLKWEAKEFARISILIERGKRLSENDKVLFQALKDKLRSTVK